MSVPVLLPRGVADSSGIKGFVQGPDGFLIGLDLTNGALLWKRGLRGRPLACANGQVVVAHTRSEHELELVLLDAESGREIRRSASASLPDWVHVSQVESPEWSLQPDFKESNVVVNWLAHSLYKGGAPMTRRKMIELEQHASGSLCIELEPDGARTQTGQASNTPCSVQATPEVVEQVAVGDICYQLLTRNLGQTTQVRMRAVDQHTAGTKWETVIAETAHRGPGPLRK